MGEKKLTRGLDPIHLEKFKNSEWFKKVYQKNKDELFLGIRNNYINIYYKGMNIAKSQGRFEKAYISDRYLGNKGESKEKSISYDEFNKKGYETIIKNVEEHVNKEKKEKREKRVQQELILRNNENYKKGKSNWFCIDMEYSKQRKNKQENQGENYGRFDIIAVNTRNKPYRVALIELKVGEGAISGESGLRKHALDWHKFKDKELFNKTEKNPENYLLKEIVEIINNNIYLEDGNYPIKKVNEKDFKTEPEFYFLICSGNMNFEEIKNETRKYLWSKEKCKQYGIKNVSSKNIEEDEEIGYDITKKGAGILYCNFLFAEKEGENIEDIIEDKNYDRKIN